MTDSLINIELDKRQAKSLANALAKIPTPRRRPQIYANALNRTSGTRGGAAGLIREAVKAEITLKAASVNRRVQRTKRASARDLQAKVTVEGRKQLPAVTSFTGTRDTTTYSGKHKPSGKGLVMRLRKGGGIERVRRGFIVRPKHSPSEPVAVSRFKPDGTKYRGKKGGTLRVIRGPSVLGVFQGKPGLIGQTTGKIGEILLREVSKDVDKELKKIARG